MAQQTAIEWTETTWNPVTGCTKVGLGCDNCYAERFAERWRGTPNHPYEQGFDLKLWPDRLNRPARWRRPRMIFVNSMSDLFHKDIPQDFVDQVFSVMEAEHRHIFQVLTKRSSRMRTYVRQRYGNNSVPSHIWLGVSVENAAHTSRIDHLQGINSPARFISFEPLLGPVGALDLTGIAWAIVGGESGPRARPMHYEWVTAIRDLCKTAKTEFFFKQWGGVRPKSGGRLLEGIEWNGFPWSVVPDTLRKRSKMSKDHQIAPKPVL
ncbi:MAG: phage Gp37/Gp68 family protein [Aestuariivita sp.]|nr:phage Gp37/Gp68 family protein [Aestuariivita sp.]MCY4345375.1 phage Gp37/Gp68 family protein [Aestuariivita sp.]